MSSDHTHSVSFTNSNLDFDLVSIQLTLQLSESILLYNQLAQLGFELDTDFSSSSQLDRSLDAFNQLFYVYVKLTFRDLSEIRNLNELGFFTQYDKWNYSGNTQNSLLFSESNVDLSFQIDPQGNGQTLKRDFVRYMVQTFLGSSKLGGMLKQKTNIVNEVIALDSVINTQILNQLQPLTNDGILYEGDYELEMTNNYYPLSNVDGTKTSTHNPVRVLVSSILNENVIDSSNHVVRREHFKHYLNPIMELHYQQNKDNIFYILYQTENYDASGVFIKNYCGPLFFDISNAIATNDLLLNPTLNVADVLSKTFEQDYDDNVFYALPADVSGGYRSYEVSNNLFADPSSEIYTLIDSYTTTTIVDLETFNGKLIPFKFINGDSLNVIIEYSPNAQDVSGSNVHEKPIPPRKYKIKINLKNFYYDYIGATKTYSIFYNKDKLDDGTLSAANVLNSAFQASGDPVLNSHGWNYTLDYDANNEPTRQTEVITSLYNTDIPHIHQAYNIQLLDSNTTNNYNNGVSDLKVGHLLSDYFVNATGSDFTWQTSDTSNEVLIVNDPNNNVYYISSSGTSGLIANGDGVGINTQSDPIFIFQLLINEPIKSADFFVLHVDTFTNQKRKNASGVIPYDHRMIFHMKMEEFTQSFYVAFLDQTFEVSQINSNTNLFLVYPPNKITTFETDVSNNPSLYDVSGYNNAFGGLYITSVDKNEDTSQLLNSQAITWDTNSSVSKMTVHLTSYTGESGTFDPTDFTLRNAKVNANGTLLDYQYYTVEI